MNIAFPAIFLFLLLLPGFVFHRLYQAREVRAADLTPFSTTVLTATAIAALINAATMLAATYWGGYHFYVGEMVRLLVSGASTNSAVALSPVFQRLNAHPFEPFAFFAATNLVAALLAGLWRFSVWRLRLDHPSRPLVRYMRPPAPWYYLFTGTDVTGVEPDAVVIATIVTFRDGSWLFTGLLEDYELTEKGELDRLVLSNAARRRLADDLPRDASRLDQQERFYPIEGDRFVLRASECVTLNIKYLVLESVDG